jgi:hypothetical protein
MQNIITSSKIQQNLFQSTKKILLNFQQFTQIFSTYGIDDNFLYHNYNDLTLQFFISEMKFMISMANRFFLSS